MKKITIDDLCQYCLANEDDIADVFECSIRNEEKVIEEIRKLDSEA